MSPAQASNIDDVLGHHTSFLDSCLKDCMLTNPELLRVFSRLMSVCVMFTNCMQVRRQGSGWRGARPAGQAAQPRGGRVSSSGPVVADERFLPTPKRFTQSMKLDSELGHLTLEHGTMRGPPTEAERAEERARKELARKVGGGRAGVPETLLSPAGI